jgi:ABC-2 type transport system ATP-binding protein
LRRDAASIKRQVGYMTQRFSLYEDLSIEENLDFVARMYGVAGRKQTIEATLDRLGLTARRAQLAGTLSGGWKQRLALAACMLHSPQLLLLDEPTAGVDPKARRDFWEEIHELAAEGITVLVSTHYMDEAERCHRLAYINLGTLLVEGTPDEVIAGSRLSTWSVALRSAGDERELARLARGLGNAAGVDTVIPFGTTLRVSGRDPAALDAALEPARAQQTFEVARTPTTLEDVFVNLMQRATADAR